MITLTESAIAYLLTSAEVDKVAIVANRDHKEF